MINTDYRVDIIDRSNIDDARILERNYKRLIRDTADIKSTLEFIALHETVVHRIETLQKETH